MVNIRLIIFLLCVTACGGGSKSSQGSGSRRGSGDVLKSLDCSASSDGGGQAGSELTLGLLASQELRHVPAEDLMLLEGKSIVSFCDIMRANAGAKLALFMFTSASCYKCQKWIEKIAGGLGEYGNTVLPIAVVSESNLKMSDTDLEELKEQVAPDLIWVRDPEKAVWSFFAPVDDPQKRVTPALLEMDTAARGFLLDDTALEAKDLVEEANTNLGLGLGGG